MLRIKLTRIGKKHQPQYRIVVTEKRSKRDGKYVEQVGFYNPLGDKILSFEVDKYQSWIQKGAQPTDTVANLFKKFSAKK
ncbi:30S ribosomal protein S16 [Candidatus Woesebacteria bacterium]|nr:30S ribosomal protein S16 [Candidatus Woesebacteria bacterium]MCD8507257.1 30S ribosomal protein S16 [Candidatus Woesebacteria bacterium]MCD8546003.1 30S ribosomal protein S16 [Candidatus Woesebacteria bacterium]